MTRHRESGGDSDSPVPAFDPVPLRQRHDGWNADKQIDFIEALGETACVAEACQRVGMSKQSAYALRARREGQNFRAAWDAALDYGISRLSDAVISRAVHGVPIPHYFQGEQIGEHRRYDERLAMFLLRYRDPLRYAKSLDRFEYRGIQEGRAFLHWHHLERLTEEAFMKEAGCSRDQIDEALRKIDRHLNGRPGERRDPGLEGESPHDVPSI